MRLLNALSKLALTSSSAAVWEFIGRLLTVLFAQDETYNEKQHRLAEARLIWQKNVVAKMDEQVTELFEKAKEQQMDAIAPVAKQLNEPENPIKTALFTQKFDEGVWDAIHRYRGENGVNLSGRLWDISGDATRKAEDIVERAQREGLTFNEVKDELSSLLTEEGKANMTYNLRRLWADHVKRNRIIAMREVWKRTGFTFRVELSRSVTADVNCQECGSAIGTEPLSTIVVDAMTGNLPPYHPWCQCEVRPLPPSADELAARIRELQGGTPTTLVKNDEQAWSDAHKEERRREFEEMLKRFKLNTQQEYFQYGRWRGADIDQMIDILRERLSGLVDKVPTMNIEWSVLSPAVGASYDKKTMTLHINSSSYTSNLINVTTGRIIHEFGHHLVMTMGDWSNYTFLTDTERSEFYSAVDDILSVIRDYTTLVPKGIGYGMKPNNNASVSAGLHQSMVEWLLAARLGSSKTSPALMAIGDMSMGIGTQHLWGHDNNYLTSTAHATEINGTLYGIAEQEGFNELWEWLFRNDGLTPDMKQGLDRFMPSLSKSLLRWYIYAQGGKDKVLHRLIGGTP